MELKNVSGSTSEVSIRIKAPKIFSRLHKDTVAPSKDMANLQVIAVD